MRINSCGSRNISNILLLSFNSFRFHVSFLLFFFSLQVRATGKHTGRALNISTWQLILTHNGRILGLVVKAPSDQGAPRLANGLLEEVWKIDITYNDWISIFLSLSNALWLRGEMRWYEVETDPADSPKTVILLGSPPKAAMLSTVHCKPIT